jgi:acyl-coenzyme A thioesterase PaaI-like protein
MNQSADSTSINKQLEIKDDHYCFGCGRLNPHGLKLTFFEGTDHSVWTAWTPAAEQQGFEGIVHGGLVTTVLDEVMGWVVSTARIWAVTARLSVSFRKPVEIGVETIARAWIVSERGRKIVVEADLKRKSDGFLLADAEGLFMRVSPDVAAAWQSRYLPSTISEATRRQ